MGEIRIEDSNVRKALYIISKCAELYEMNLNRRNLLFICMNKHKNISVIETKFHDHNFRHLTGVMSTDQESGAAKNFYQNALKKKLTAEQLIFKQDGSIQMKLSVLPNIFTPNLGKANMMANYDSVRPKLYTDKIIGTVRACVGFVSADDNYFYVPNTVLKEDTRNLSKNTIRIVATYRKFQTDSNYKECVYAAKNVDWDYVWDHLDDFYKSIPKPENGDPMQRKPSAERAGKQKKRKKHTPFVR